MDPISIATLVTVLTGAVSTVLFYSAKYIKKSTCFGSSIEFNRPGVDSVPPSLNNLALRSQPRVENGAQGVLV
jgi:hypothetical protein